MINGPFYTYCRNTLHRQSALICLSVCLSVSLSHTSHNYLSFTLQWNVIDFCSRLTLYFLHSVSGSIWTAFAVLNLDRTKWALAFVCFCFLICSSFLYVNRAMLHSARYCYSKSSARPSVCLYSVRPPS